MSCVATLILNPDNDKDVSHRNIGELHSAEWMERARPQSLQCVRVFSGSCSLTQCRYHILEGKKIKKRNPRTAILKNLYLARRTVNIKLCNSLSSLFLFQKMLLISPIC